MPCMISEWSTYGFDFDLWHINSLEVITLYAHKRKVEHSENKWLFLDPSDNLVYRANHTLKSASTSENRKSQSNQFIWGRSYWSHNLIPYHFLLVKTHEKSSWHSEEKSNHFEVYSELRTLVNVTAQGHRPIKSQRLNLKTIENLSSPAP